MKGAYYNDNDPFCAEWLRRLIAAGAIPAGEVDERSIAEVEPGDLRGYTQHHFFSGIAGWAYALELAGWGDRPVWTASLPCQPLSSAGQRRGHLDERHLWPAFYELVAECRPATLIGEQIASRLGREWLAGIRADLEHLGYAVGGADLPAACAGAPHIRQRLFWVANSADARWRARPGDECRAEGRAALAHNGSAAGGLGHADIARSQGRGIDAGEHAAGASDAGFWSDAVWLPCLDGKARRTQSGLFPLASGLPIAVDGLGPVSRVGALRGSGNAITPQAAAEFIRAVLDIRLTLKTRSEPT